MPYKVIGKCVYHKNADGSTGDKKGCTDGSVKAYLRALYANESVNESFQQFLEEVEGYTELDEAREPKIVRIMRDIIINGPTKVKDPVTGKSYKISQDDAQYYIDAYERLSPANKDRIEMVPLVNFTQLARTRVKKAGEI